MGTEIPNDSVDIREYVRPVWSRLPVILLVVLTATAATYLYYSGKPKVYQSSTQIQVTPSELGQVVVGTQSEKSTSPESLATLLSTTPVATEAARRLRFKGEPRVLLGRVAATADKDSEFMQIAGTASVPEDAARLANAFAQAFIYVRVRERRQGARIARIAAERELGDLGSDETAQDQRRELGARLRRLRSIESLPAGAGGLRQLDPALPSAAPIEPNPKQSAIFALAVSLMLAVAGAFGLERIDRRIKRPEDVEALYEAPVLTELPSVSDTAPMNGLAAALPPEFREPLRKLRTNLDLASLDHRLRKILVTSATPGEGKSTVVRNLAIAYREEGARVVVIDTDLRRPTLDKLLLLEREPGLTTVLTGGETLETVLQSPPVEVQGLEMLAKLRHAGNTNGRNGNGHVIGTLAVLPSGPLPANPPAVLAAGRMRSLFDQLANEFDVVLIDSPPLLAFSDAVPLLSAADGVVLVTRLGATTNDAAARALEQVKRVPDANIVGVVVNGLSKRAHESRAYAYQYAYHA